MTILIPLPQKSEIKTIMLVPYFWEKGRNTASPSLTLPLRNAVKMTAQDSPYSDTLPEKDKIYVSLRVNLKQTKASSGTTDIKG